MYPKCWPKVIHWLLWSTKRQTISTAIGIVRHRVRMNTDVRRSIFCVIMSAEDFMDASEHLLSLPLNRTQQCEIARVLVDCCAQEKTFDTMVQMLL